MKIQATALVFAALLLLGTDAQLFGTNGGLSNFLTSYPLLTAAFIAPFFLNNNNPNPSGIFLPPPPPPPGLFFGGGGGGGGFFPPPLLPPPMIRPFPPKGFPPMPFYG